MSDHDYYELLGIDATANQEDIEAGYRRAAQYWHPDRNKTLNASDMMAAVNEAHDVLTDRVRRFDYDRRRATDTTASRTRRSGTSDSSTRPRQNRARSSRSAPTDSGRNDNPTTMKDYWDRLGDQPRSAIVFTAIMVCLTVLGYLAVIFI